MGKEKKMAQNFGKKHVGRLSNRLNYVRLKLSCKIILVYISRHSFVNAYDFFITNAIVCTSFLYLRFGTVPYAYRLYNFSKLKTKNKRKNVRSHSCLCTMFITVISMQINC